MNKITTGRAVCAALLGLMIAAPVQGQLRYRVDGLIYDEDRDVTWMRYVNTIVDTEYCGTLLPNCTDGRVTWDEAEAFVAWLNSTYNPPRGNAWRLPVTPTTTDPGCSLDFNEGYTCTQSELGHLYYRELLNLAGANGLVNRGPFIDIQTSTSYWSAWDFVSPGAPSDSPTFHFGTGYQGRAAHNEKRYVWLVHDGDIAPATECDDEIDNDGDGNVDMDDAGCDYGGDNDESGDVSIHHRYIQLRYIPANLAIWNLVREGMPWCPMGFPGCPGNRLSIHEADAGIPDYMADMGKAIWHLVHADSQPKLMPNAVDGLRKVLQNVPTGVRFNQAMKDELMRSISSLSESPETRHTNRILTSEMFVTALNAIELDWRVPELSARKAKPEALAGVDFNGMLWVGPRQAKKRGQVTLSVRADYEAFPVDSQFSPTWPFMTYVLDFDGQLEKGGYLDLRFYIKPLRFLDGPAQPRVLRLDKEGLTDVTAGWDGARGILLAKSDRPGSFIVVGKKH